MTTVTNKPKALSQPAFNAGWSAFYRGEPEFYLTNDRSEIWRKEYTRGWWGAYEKNKVRSS